MSFRKVKPIQPELDRLKKKKSFMERGENLLDIKREQLLSSLKKNLQDFFELQKKFRQSFRECFALLEKTYEAMGENRINTIAKINQITYDPEVEITYYNQVGVDVPKIKFVASPKEKNKQHLPNYSLIQTPMTLDKLIEKLRDLQNQIPKVAELNSIVYHFSSEYQKIQRRIDALRDIAIPRTETNIRMIEDILADNEIEEHIQLKKIKEKLSAEQI